VRRSDRLDGILAELSENGSVSARDLVLRFDASPATIRRDLELLEEQKLLTRSHGGAVANGTVYELPVRYRSDHRAEEKRRIADAALERIDGAQTICFSGGTTTTEVARRLRGRSLTVVTNAVNIASELVISETIRLVLTGGVARPQTYELIGPLAEQSLEKLNMDVTFLGVDGINPAGVTTHDEVEAQTDRKMVERATRVIVVCDSSKIGRAALSEICPLTEVDELITDTGAPAAEIKALRAAGIEVTQV